MLASRSALGIATPCRKAQASKRASLPVPDAAAPAASGSASPAGGNAAKRRRRSEPAAPLRALLRGASSGGAAGALGLRAFSGLAFLVTGFEDPRERRRVTSLLISNGGRVLDSIPLPQVGSAAATQYHPVGIGSVVG